MRWRRCDSYQGSKGQRLLYGYQARVGFKGKFTVKVSNPQDLLTILLYENPSIKGDMALDKTKYWVSSMVGKKIKKNKPKLEDLFNRDSNCFEGMAEFVNKNLRDVGLELVTIEMTDILLPKKLYQKADLTFLEVNMPNNNTKADSSLEFDNNNLLDKLEEDTIDKKIIADNSLVSVENVLDNNKVIEYKKCEKCGASNPLHAKYCFNCASAFTKKCGNCGAPIKDGEFVCKNCKSVVV